MSCFVIYDREPLTLDAEECFIEPCLSFLSFFAQSPLYSLRVNVLPEK
jgi:hypothetical protein